MNKTFQEKVVFVTGSTKGIGLAIGEKFALNGAKVFLNGRDEKSFNLAKLKIPNASFIKGDLSNPEILNSATTELINRTKRLDTLICNLGSGKSVIPGEENFDEWNRMFNLNFFSAVNTIKNLKTKLEVNSGSIVCISSICGNEIVHGAPLTYSCSKAALNAYVKGISRPLGKKGVRINAIAPGNIIFKGSTWESKLKANNKNVEKMLRENVALSRFGNPDDIADLALYLASDKANFVTGSIWNIDGGQQH